jgi:four helix bundle protein
MVEMITIRHFSQLLVWQQGHSLVLEIYRMTKKFPRDEMFCLVAQMRRAAISITSNIAEGFGRRSKPDKRHFYVIAAGSLSELMNQMMIAKDLGYLEQGAYAVHADQVVSISKLLNRLITSLDSPKGLKA